MMLLTARRGKSFSICKIKGGKEEIQWIGGGAISTTLVGRDAQVSNLTAVGVIRGAIHWVLGGGENHESQGQKQRFEVHYNVHQKEGGELS